MAKRLRLNNQSHQGNNQQTPLTPQRAHEVRARARNIQQYRESLLFQKMPPLENALEALQAAFDRAADQAQDFLRQKLTETGERIRVLEAEEAHLVDARRVLLGVKPNKWIVGGLALFDMQAARHFDQNRRQSYRDVRGEADDRLSSVRLELRTRRQEYQHWYGLVYPSLADTPEMRRLRSLLTQAKADLDDCWRTLERADRDLEECAYLLGMRVPDLYNDIKQQHP